MQCPELIHGQGSHNFGTGNLLS